MQTEVGDMRSTLAATAVALALAACGGGGAGFDYKRALERQNLVLPNTISIEDFNEACIASNVTDPGGLLESLKLEARGKGPGAYIKTSDLLTACGPECSPDDGALGSLILRFAIYDQTR